MRQLRLAIALICLAGCSQDIALKDPATGAIATCRAGGLVDLNPWSQQDMCVEDHVAEGWVVQ